MPKDENRYSNMVVIPALYYADWDAKGTGKSILLCPKCSSGPLPPHIDHSLGNIHQYSVEYDNANECVKIKYYCEHHSHQLMTLYMNQHKGNTHCYWDELFEPNPMDLETGIKTNGVNEIDLPF